MGKRHTERSPGLRRTMETAPRDGIEGTPKGWITSADARDLEIQI